MIFLAQEIFCVSPFLGDFSRAGVEGSPTADGWHKRYSYQFLQYSFLCIKIQNTCANIIAFPSLPPSSLLTSTRHCGVPEGLITCHSLVTAGSNNWQISCHNQPHVQVFSRAMAGGERFDQFGSISSRASRLALGTGVSPMVGFPARLCIQLPSLWKPQKLLWHVQKQPKAPQLTWSWWWQNIGLGIEFCFKVIVGWVNLITELKIAGWVNFPLIL